MMKRIWRIPLFLLLVIILGISTTTVVVYYAERPAIVISVALGTGGLIDGYHVKYGENLTARWAAHVFRLSSNGSFSLDLRLDYVSENPTSAKVFYSEDNVSTLVIDPECVTSVVLLCARAAYELEPWGDYAHESVSGVIPIYPKSTDSKSCSVEYCGNFSSSVNVTKVMAQAFGLEFQLSWVRVFRDSNATLYYQWLQGDSNVWQGRELELDKTYDNLSGGFKVYYPIPESVASALVPWEFDYVKWIRDTV
jgi:hypothetical protein